MVCHHLLITKSFGMKTIYSKFFIIITLTIILVGCSKNNKDIATQLIENCANDKAYKIFYEVVSKGINNIEWLKHEPKILSYLNNNLSTKLKNGFFNINIKVKTIYNGRIEIRSEKINYERHFMFCEKSYTKYPIKFKAKWENKIIQK